jgi:ADP-heptose:LPS heptosyltransferase
MHCANSGRDVTETQYLCASLRLFVCGISVEDTNIERVLIFLLGSLGDTLVALPALHLIARKFPSTERRVLTNVGVHAKAASMASLLDGSGLVHGYYSFPGPSKDADRLRMMMRLAREIRRWKPDALIYLHEQRGHMVALRDAVLFRMLGITRLVGVPLSRALQKKIFYEKSGRFEHRSEYLARSLAPLGDLRLAHRSSWDLRFSTSERERARSQLDSLRACRGMLAMSIGTKVDVKDWGDDNWRALLRELSNWLPHWGLIAIGAPVEHDQSAAVLAAWHGLSVNLCGKLSVRESGAVLEGVRLFICHDSGPMHLAAAVGTRCAAVFSARSLPGAWFPYGTGHTVFYKQTDCAGCRLDVCAQFKKKCIAAITVAEVAAGIMSMLSAPNPGLREVAQ